MRCAIYARFSSDLQDRKSIADQVSLCRDRASLEKWTVEGVYSDAAISGSSIHNRPGLQELLSAAKAQRFDIVLTESIDRLSRDLEDIAGLHKRLSFMGVHIVTLADGAVNQMHIGLKGLMASMFLADLADKTRRGQMGNVREGKIPGGRCYGYDPQPDGSRTINEQQAAVVRRIFSEYVAGRSPLAIATRLNAEKVPSPRGGQWNASTLNGSRKRQNGILSNTLYIGRIVYNRQRFIKDPATGKRQARPNPPSEWMEGEAPDMRIIEQGVWDAAQARRTKSDGTALRNRRRPPRLLSGLLECGCCGSSYIVKTRDYVACSSLLNKGTCANRRTVRMTDVETRVLDAVRKHLLSPEVVERAVAFMQDEAAKAEKAARRMRREDERSLGEIDRKIARMIDAIESGVDPRSIADRLNALQSERRSLAARVSAEAKPVPATQHPMSPAAYRKLVEGLHDALRDGDDGPELTAKLRRLIRRVRILPMGAGEPVQLEIVGSLAGMLERRENTGTAVVVAGARNGHGSHEMDFRLTG